MPAPPHDATGHTWHHSDRVLLDIMTRGTAAIIGGSYESNTQFNTGQRNEQWKVQLSWRF